MRLLKNRKTRMADTAVVDPHGMMAHVIAFPQWLGESVAWGGPEGLRGIDSICFVGMGGSAIPGESVKALYEDLWKKPMTVVRGGALPQAVGRNTLVFLTSCSGNTAETIEIFEDVLERGAPAIVVASGGRLLEFARTKNIRAIRTPSGIPPRAAFPYLLGPIVSTVHPLVARDPFDALISDTLSGLKMLARQLGPDTSEADNPAQKIAQALHGRRPLVVTSPGTGKPAGGRWRNQLAENSKVSADLWVAPECLHNVVEPFFTNDSNEVPVLLRTVDEIPRVTKALDALQKRCQQTGRPFVRVDAVGRHPLERFLSLVLIADFVSVYLAFLNGVDPTAIPEIEKIKGLMG